MEPTRLTVCAIMRPGRAAHLARWAAGDYGNRMDQEVRKAQITYVNHRIRSMSMRSQTGRKIGL